MNEKLKKVLSNKTLRVRYFQDDFEMWYTYHSKLISTPFHLEWIEALEGSDSILIEAFRGSAKTTIVRWYVLWCMIYTKEKYIIVQSYEDTLSGAWVRGIAKMSMVQSIIEDHGKIFPFEQKREDLAKSGATSWESTTGVKIESRGLGSTLRGANDPDKTGDSTRPTLLILDDVDVDKSVANTRIIDQNEAKIIGETINALDPIRRRVIFLGNTINEDGIVPRFRKKYTDWKQFRQPLIVDGKCVWSERYTPDIIKKLKQDGERSFGQNYLLIPFTGGDTIIKRTSIRYAEHEPQGCRNVIGIDPAFSTKTGTDGMGLTLTAHMANQKFIKYMLAFHGDQKNEEYFCNYVEELYRKEHVSIINVESNNGGEIIARMLKARGLAVKVVTAHRDKVTRLREWEGAFERGEIFFLPGTEKGVEQLLSFPHGANDDMVDSMVHSFTNEKKVFVSRF